MAAHLGQSRGLPRFERLLQGEDVERGQGGQPLQRIFRGERAVGIQPQLDAVGGIGPPHVGQQATLSLEIERPHLELEAGKALRYLLLDLMPQPSRVSHPDQAVRRQAGLASAKRIVIEPPLTAPPPIQQRHLQAKCQRRKAGQLQVIRGTTPVEVTANLGHLGLEIGPVIDTQAGQRPTLAEAE